MPGDDRLDFLRGGGAGDSDSDVEPVASEEQLVLRASSEDDARSFSDGAPDGGGGVAAGWSGATDVSPVLGSLEGAALAVPEKVHCDWTALFRCPATELRW